MIDFGLKSQTAKLMLARLTPRELQVVELFAMGHTRSEIAESLEMKARTVQVHLDSVRTKWGDVESHGIPRIWFCAKMNEGV